MKNILNNYTYLSLFLALSLVISSCSKDDNFTSDASKVIPILKGIDGETIVFSGNTGIYTLTPYRGGSDYIWSAIGAVMQPVTGRPDQVKVIFEQFSQPASLSVHEVAANGKSSEPVTIDITVFGTPCDWTLETSDTYGDGWNGGHVDVTYGGITTEYSADGVASAVFTIGIPNGAEFSITYVSGGGTGGGPGWESENYFKLTSPDGTVWEEGSHDYSGIPTPGVITSGTNVCP